MKNNIPDINQQIPPQPFYPYPEDEISLVDIAKILVKKRKVFFFTFGIIFAITIFLTWMTWSGSKKEMYQSVYKLAETDYGKLLDPPEAILELANSSHKETVMAKLAEQGKQGTEEIELKFENPKGTSIVTITSSASKETYELMKAMHSGILEIVSTEQKTVIEKGKKNIDEQVFSMKASLEKLETEKKDLQLSKNPKAQEMASSYVSQIVQIDGKINEYQSRKTLLKEGEIVQVAQKKTMKVGTGATKVLGIGIVIGFVLAIVAVFTTEFIDQVRKSLAEETQ